MKKGADNTTVVETGSMETSARHLSIRKFARYKRVVEKGVEFVKVPVRDIQAITDQLEDAEDVCAYDRAKQQGGEGFPQDIMRRLVHGENPVKVIREWRGLTQGDLAKAVGSKPAYISQLETGNREGSLRFMAQIAEALETPLDDLVG